jgi:hypothetical protein
MYRSTSALQQRKVPIRLIKPRKTLLKSGVCSEERGHYRDIFVQREKGARYLDPKYSRWLSPDPALTDYIPGAPINDEVKKKNGELPGMGGVFNTVNLHLYHYAGNNPVKYTDPDGEILIIPFMIKATAVVMAAGVYVAANMPSKEDHYNRNENNMTTDDAGNKITTVAQAEKAGFKRLGIGKGEANAESMDRYHEMGTGTPDPKNNNKYVLGDETGSGSSELIFDGDGNLVEDSVNGGTYNMVDAGDTLASGIGHAVKDVLPYYIYGNDETDAKTTTFWDRVRGSYNGPIPPPVKE